MQQSFSRDLLFFRIILGLFILMAGSFVLWVGYKESFMVVHQFRLDWLDKLMPHLTHLGTGTIVSSVFALLLLPRDKPLLLSMWSGLLIVMVVIYVLKWTLFRHWDRPGLVFPIQDIHFITLERIFSHSFPSGHSAASAAEWTAIAVILARYRSWLGGLAALITIFIGYTRIYIAVHFLGDVVVGLAIGWAATEFCLARFHGRFEKMIARKPRQWQQFMLWGTIVLLIGSLLRLMIKVYPEDVLYLDQTLFLWLNALHTDWLDPVMAFVSQKLVWVPVYLLLLILIGRKFGWKRMGVFLVSVGLAILIADQLTSGLLKPLVGRLRPCQPGSGISELVHTVGGHCGGKFSFASSHAANFFAMAVMLGQLFRERIWWVLTLSVAALVAYSRIYLGVHFPGDVLVGGLIGAGAAWGAFRFYLWLEKKI